MKIYVVTQGVYSDYSIVGLFSTEEKAKNMVAYYNNSENYDTARVEEFELDELTKLTDRGWKLYDVAMLKDGTVERIEISDTLYMLNSFMINKHRSPQVMSIYVMAKNEKHAVKIANERRAMIIASNEWI